MMESREERLKERLSALDEKLQRISDREARAALIRGFGAEGEFENERDRLLALAEQILDELIKLSEQGKKE
jgi:hypothetical protein